MVENVTLPIALGFVGNESVAPETARSLLTDFLKAHYRTNKGAEVRFIVPIEPLTESLADLCDFALVSGFKLSLLGHAAAFSSKKVNRFVVGGATAVELAPESTIPLAVVRQLGRTTYARLILLADPNVDDDALVALERASAEKIPTRDLLNGLELVLFEDEPEPEGEEEQVSPRRQVEEEEYEDEESEEDEDESEDESEGEDEDEDEEDEEGEDDEESEGEDDEDEEDEDDEEENEEVEDEDDEEDEDEDGEDDEDLEDEDDEEEEEEEVAPARNTRTAAKKAAPTKKAAPKKTAAAEHYTEAGLTRLAKRDEEAFWDIAADFGKTPGRGIRIPNVIAHILREQDGGEAEAPPRRSTAPAGRRPAGRPATKAAPAARKSGGSAGAGAGAALAAALRKAADAAERL